MANISIGLCADSHLERLEGNGVALAGACTWLRAQGADYLILLGDAVNDDPTQVDEVVTALKGDGSVPYALALGNHDTRLDPSLTRAMWGAEFLSQGGTTQHLWDAEAEGTTSIFTQCFAVSAKVWLIVLDNNWRWTGTAWQHREEGASSTAENSVHADDLTWLDAKLAEADAAGAYVVLAMHHSLFSDAHRKVDPPYASTSLVTNARDVRLVLRQHKSVVAVMAGHVHANWNRALDPNETDGRPVAYAHLNDIGYGAAPLEHAGVLVIDDDTGDLQMVGRADIEAWGAGLESRGDVPSWKTKTWVKTGEAGNWSIAANWSPAVLPAKFDLVRVPAGTADLNANAPLINTPPCYIWVEDGWDGTFAIRQNVNVHGCIRIPAGSTLETGETTTNRICQPLQVWIDGTITGVGDLRVKAMNIWMDFWRHTGTFSHTGPVLIWPAFGGSYTNVLTNYFPVNFGDLDVEMYYPGGQGPYTLRFEDLLACGDLQIGAKTGLEGTFECANLESGAVLFDGGDTERDGVGNLILLPGNHQIGGLALGNAASGSVTFGGNVYIDGNLTLADITADFASATLVGAGPAAVNLNGSDGTLNNTGGSVRGMTLTNFALNSGPPIRTHHCVVGSGCTGDDIHKVKPRPPRVLAIVPR